MSSSSYYMPKSKWIYMMHVRDIVFVTKFNILFETDFFGKKIFLHNSMTG